MTSSGWSVAVSGNTVVAGAHNHEVGSNPGQGAAYVFVMPTTGPWVNATQTAELTASDGQPGDELGYSVAISGNTIVAGARPRQVEGHDDQGAAYVYTEPSGGWVTTSADTAELTASDGYTDDNLGDSVAVSGTTIVAGAPRHDAELEHRRLRRRVRVRARERWLAGEALGGRPPVVVPRPPARLRPSSVGSISGGHGEITATLSCPAGGAACATVSLKATVKEHLKGGKITAITAGTKKKARTTTKQVVVASGGVTLAAGATKTLTLKLNSTGRALLCKVRQAQGDRDRQLGRQDDQDGHRHSAKGRKAERRREEEVILRSRRCARACYSRLRRSMTMLNEYPSSHSCKSRH